MMTTACVIAEDEKATLIFWMHRSRIEKQQIGTSDRRSVLWYREAKDTKAKVRHKRERPDDKLLVREPELQGTHDYQGDR